MAVARTSVLQDFSMYVSAALDFNKAALTGALDIIAVRHDDGTIMCTPFHVRFGRIRLAKTTAKVVDIYVNDERAELTMQLGEAGEAYFASEGTPTGPDSTKSRRSRTEGQQGFVNSIYSYFKGDTAVDAGGDGMASEIMSDELGVDGALGRMTRPSSAQLQSLRLRPGPNKITFGIENSICIASTLFLLSPYSKIVVSDVDGTITKSDVLGHLFFFVGRDWTHAGVAQLYSNIATNGYHIIYLTSRALGQADATKLYLHNIKQFAYSDADYHMAGGKGSLPPGAATLTTTAGTVAMKSGPADLPKPVVPGPGAASIATGTAGAVVEGGGSGLVAAAITGLHQTPIYQLPLGPVITSPDRLLTALTREVILRRPQEFKIAALEDIRNLFPAGIDPFYAGFGNRATDVESYLKVGVPKSKIFIINADSEVRLYNLMYKKSYPTINALVHEMFPPVTEVGITEPEVGSRYGKPVPMNEAFSDANYWRPQLPQIPDSDDEKKAPTRSKAKKPNGVTPAK